MWCGSLMGVEPVRSKRQILLVGNVLACVFVLFFFFQAEDGIRDAQESRGLGDVYKRQSPHRWKGQPVERHKRRTSHTSEHFSSGTQPGSHDCLLYTSDAADDLLCVDLGGRRIIKKKKH